MKVDEKLQIKPGQSVALLHVPPGLDLGIADAAPDCSTADAVVLFVTNRAELDDRNAPLVAAAERDALAWVAYPKAGQLGTDLNRDSVAGLLGAEGVRPVRQVSVDPVWSALRFRASS